MGGDFLASFAASRAFFTRDPLEMPWVSPPLGAPGETRSFPGFEENSRAGGKLLGARRSLGRGI